MKKIYKIYINLNTIYNLIYSINMDHIPVLPPYPKKPILAHRQYAGSGPYIEYINSLSLAKTILKTNSTIKEIVDWALECKKISNNFAT